MQPLVLAIDLGSSSVRTALFRANGARLLPSSASRSYAIRYSADGAAELDPLILLRAARACFRETASKAPPNESIELISGSGFWHSLLGLDKAGQPLTPVYTWADARAAPDAARLREEFSEREIQQRTGCMLRAPFWPAKLRWLRRTEPAVFRRVAVWISPASWIFRELFGVLATSASMASGTGLYQLATGQWDADFCHACDVDPVQLGPIAASFDIFNARVFTTIGDGAASNLGSGANGAGRLAINVGTSAAARLILPRSARVPRGLFKFVVDQQRVVVGGAISNAGNLRKWSLRELRLAQDPPLDRAAAAHDALTVLPFWVEERAPTWPGEMRGALVGLTAVTSATDILRALTTSVFYRLGAIVDALARKFGEPGEIIVSGGILQSPEALAILADTLGRDLRRCREMESSLRGAAVRALEQSGAAVKALPAGRLVKHRPSLSERHRARRAEQEALERRLAR